MSRTAPELAVHEVPMGLGRTFRFSVKRGGSRPWPVLERKRGPATQNYGLLRRPIQRPGPLTGFVLRMPKTASVAEALAAFEHRAPWFERYAGAQHYKADRTQILLNGAYIPVCFDAEQRAAARIEDDALVLRPPRANARKNTLGDAVIDCFVDETLRAITPHVIEFAAKLDKPVGKILATGALRMWGSCDSRHNVRFNWRLAMVPPFVQRYLAAHEVAHFIHRHHQREFWQLVGELLPEWPIADHWLTLCGWEAFQQDVDQLQPTRGTRQIEANRPVLFLASS